MRLPVMVQVTFESTGTMLLGTDLSAVIATLEMFPVDVIGMNCATGPEAMQRHLEGIARQWRGQIGCMPNAGLPTLKDGKVHYPLDAAAFAKVFAPMVEAVGLNVAGGCCGTTPEHIRETVLAVRPLVRATVASPAVPAAKGICAIGISRPKKTPRPTPTATPRRLKCHRRGCSRCGPSQRNQRFS
jgi:5-methyltetrahydrofolate--homocysteine methyltransferase